MKLKVIVVLVSLVLVLCSACSYPRSTQKPANTVSVQSTNEESVPNSPGITLAEYNKIEIGMSYQQVCNIIGSKGEEGISTERSKGYAWYSDNGSGQAIFAFIDGKLAAKQNVGLTE